jgi:hypothetical protein
VKQIEMLCPPDPIMRRLYADRKEKRVTHGATRSEKPMVQQLDFNDSNQRRL